MSDGARSVHNDSRIIYEGLELGLPLEMARDDDRMAWIDYLMFDRLIVDYSLFWKVRMRSRPESFDRGYELLYDHI